MSKKLKPSRWLIYTIISGVLLLLIAWIILRNILFLPEPANAQIVWHAVSNNVLYGKIENSLGESIENLEVYLTDHDERKITTTDINGFFRFENIKRLKRIDVAYINQINIRMNPLYKWHNGTMGLVMVIILD